jgi:hypothetical protein
MQKRGCISRCFLESLCLVDHCFQGKLSNIEVDFVGNTTFPLLQHRPKTGVFANESLIFSFIQCKAPHHLHFTVIHPRLAPDKVVEQLKKEDVLIDANCEFLKERGVENKNVP